MTTNEALLSDWLAKYLKPPTKKSGAQGHDTEIAAVPGYLNSNSKDAEGVIDHNGKQVAASVALPIMELDLPMNHLGEPIDEIPDCHIVGWGAPQPYSDDLSAKANESRKVTVKLRITVLGWEFGWPKDMAPASATASASSAKNQVILEGAE